MAALQARHVLDGQEVDGHLVDCGWLKEGTHHLSDLHSKVCDEIICTRYETHFTFYIHIFKLNAGFLQNDISAKKLGLSKFESNYINDT